MAMHIHSRTHYIFLAIICMMFSVSQAEAQLWGKLKSAVKDKAQDIVAEKVSDKDKKSSEKEKNQKKPSSSKQNPQSASVKDNTQKQATKTQKASPAIVTYQTGTPNGDLDIIGLRLGMSPSQAEAALKAHNSDYKISYQRRNQTDGSNYVKKVFAATSDKLTTIVLHFIPPPSKNKLFYIKKKTAFKDIGPTVEAYDKAFVKKYGGEFYSTRAAQKLANTAIAKNPNSMTQPMPVGNHDIKVIQLNSGQKSADSESFYCYGHIRNLFKYKVTDGLQFDRDEKCGLILASSHLGQHDIPVISSYEMTLIDYNEWNKSKVKTAALKKAKYEKSKQEKLGAAAKKDADLF